MATWHQQRTGYVRPDPADGRIVELYVTKEMVEARAHWLVVDDLPGNMRSVVGPFVTEAAARKRLEVWQTNGRDTRHCYLLKPI